MDEQNPQHPDDDSAPRDEWDDTHPVFGPSTPPEDDHTTRPIPPYAPAQPPESQSYYGQPGPVPGPYSGPYAGQTQSRNRGLTAAVLVGALVLGGAAGVGGSAAFHAFQNDDSVTNTSGTSGNYHASSTAVVKDGTVEKVASAVLPSVVKVNVTGSSESGSGSGIILTKDGQILTNNHVVQVAGTNGSISVNFNDGTTKKATVVGTDPVTDIAVIKVAGVDNLTPATLGKSGALQVGQTVVAVGSPYGLNATVTSGIVSALNRPVSVSTAEQEPDSQDPFGLGGGQQQQQGGSGSSNLSTTYPAIQTDAAINPGNSGGALVDMSGRVVGINSSIRTASDSSSSSDEGGSIGLGFAIPIDEVLPIVNQITDHQKPTHARLGVSVADVTGKTLNQGAVLHSLENGGAADKAGLKDGDVITKVDNVIIDGSESLVATIRGHRPGDQVQITYLRSGKTHTTTASLGSDASTQDS
jgi:putative serine protease PepD